MFWADLTFVLLYCFLSVFFLTYQLQKKSFKYSLASENILQFAFNEYFLVHFSDMKELEVLVAADLSSYTHTVVMSVVTSQVYGYNILFHCSSVSKNFHMYNRSFVLFSKMEKKSPEQMHRMVKLKVAYMSSYDSL